MENKIKDGNQNIPDINALCKTAASALINWRKSQEEVKEILKKEGLNEDEARQILALVVPTLVAKKKERSYIQHHNWCHSVNNRNFATLVDFPFKIKSQMGFMGIIAARIAICL